MIKNEIWYAVQIGADDNDWSYGSYDEQEALNIAKTAAENNPDWMIRIAVIDQGEDGNADPICIEERIVQESE